MDRDINRILTKKINECNGDMNKLQESLSEYFDVPKEDIQTNIRMTIPVKENMIKKDDDTVNVNLTLNVKEVEPVEDYYDDEELYTDEEIEDAKEEGIIEGKLEVARNLYDENIMSLEEISKITGLSLDELNDI